MLQRLRALVLGLSLTVAACGPAYKPPALPPEASRAWDGLQAQRVLDMIRDVAQDGCACSGGQAAVFPEATVRIVTEWHMSAITIVHAGAEGWRPAVRASLTELRARLTPDERARLGPYLDLALAVFEGVA